MSTINMTEILAALAAARDDLGRAEGRLMVIDRTPGNGYNGAFNEDILPGIRNSFAKANTAWVNASEAVKALERKRKPARNTVEDPECEECGKTMNRYRPALDTGKMGWQCGECGWSWDDE